MEDLAKRVAEEQASLRSTIHVLAVACVNGFRRSPQVISVSGRIRSSLCVQAVREEEDRRRKAEEEAAKASSAE